MTETTPKSRLPRTSTLVLIAVVLLIVGGMLAVWSPYHRNRMAIAEVERLGGFTETGIVRPFWIPDAVDDEHLTVLERVKTVNLFNPGIGDAGPEQLRGLTDLEYLTLINCQISDAGLENLQGLTRLETLWLDYNKVSDVGLEHLRGLNNLRVVSLNGTQVSDAGLVHLRGLKNLENLNLNNTQVTQAGIEKLHNDLPKCRIIWTQQTE